MTRKGFYISFVIAAVLHTAVFAFDFLPVSERQKSFYRVKLGAFEKMPRKIPEKLPGQIEPVELPKENVLPAFNEEIVTLPLPEVVLPEPKIRQPKPTVTGKPVTVDPTAKGPFFEKKITDKDSRTNPGDLVTLPKPLALPQPKTPVLKKNMPAKPKKINAPSIENKPIKTKNSKKGGNIILKPEYPKIARQRGYQGTVDIKVILDPSGKIADAKIVKSSGYRLLDNAALEAVRKSKFDNTGISEQTLQFEFKLTE